MFFLFCQWPGFGAHVYKNGPNPAFFVYFHPFLITISIIPIEKSIDGVLGIRTRGRRIVGANYTTEPISLCLFICHILLLSFLCSSLCFLPTASWWMRKPLRKLPKNYATHCQGFFTFPHFHNYLWKKFDKECVLLFGQSLWHSWQSSQLQPQSREYSLTYLLCKGNYHCTADLRV